MRKIKYRKNGLPRRGLYSGMVSPVIGAFLSVAIGAYGANYVMANSLLGKGFSKEKIEQRVEKQESVLVNRLLTDLFIRNPVSREGRNLAYFRNNFGEPEKLMDDLVNYAQYLIKKRE